MSDIYHYNWLDPIIDSEETILAIRNKSLELMKLGITIMDYQGEGTSAKRQFVAPISEILAETRYALKQKNPGKYGAIVRESSTIYLG